MKLPGIFEKFTSPKPRENEPFIALKISSDLIKTAIWEINDGVVKVNGIGNVSYSGDWKEVIKSTDEGILQASKDNVNAEKAEKVIFGLPNSWITDDKIEPEQLSNLKKLCSELSIKPLGFVVVPEAIANFLQKQEGSPLTAILLGFGKTEIVISLVRVGKIDGTYIVSRSEKIIDDVVVAFEKFTHVEVLPSRMLLYNGNSDLEIVKQELIAFPWQTRGSFLHFPKIEILDPDTDIKAVALAGGMELGKEMDIKMDISDMSVENTNMSASENTNEIKKETATEQISMNEPSNIEHVVEEDALGFIKEKDILVEVPPKESISEEENINNIQMEKTQSEDEKNEPKKRIAFHFPQFNKPNISLSFPLFSGGRKKLIIAGIVSVILCVGIISFLAYWNLPKATVTLLIDPKTLERNEDIIGDPKSTAIDVVNKVVPINVIEITKSGSKTVDTTGKKTIGDKASGEVTIYNKTNNEKIFKSGEIITSGNLKFTLNGDVTVASQSSTKTGTTFGTAKVKITASQIGVDSNLGANTDFTFKEYPQASYSASNETAFTGGSSKEVTAVSKDDLNKLMTSLTEELKQKAQNEISDKIPKGSTFVTKSYDVVVLKKTFNKEEGTQSPNVSLDIEVQMKVPTYNSEDLKSLIIKGFQNEIPDGYDLKETNVSIKTEVKEIKKDGKIIFTSNFKANLFPKINSEDIKTNIVGKSPMVVEKYFRNLPNIVGFEIVSKPKLSSFLNTMPHKIDNITVAVTIRK